MQLRNDNEDGKIMINLRNNSEVEDSEFRDYAYMGGLEGEEKNQYKAYAFELEKLSRC